MKEKEAMLLEENKSVMRQLEGRVEETETRSRRLLEETNRSHSDAISSLKQVN